MRAQTTLEFIIILASVSVMALAAVLYYGNLQSSAKSILGYVENSPIAAVNPSFLIPMNGSGFTSPPAPAPQQMYSATISQRNESIYYPLDDQGILVNFTQYNHCTNVNFFGNPYSPEVECGGTTDAYDYRIFDPGCLAPGYPYSRTYCIIPNNMSYAIYSTGSPPVLAYDFVLEIASDAGTATASVSNSSATSILYMGGRAIGNVTVSDAYSQSPSMEETLIVNGTQSYSYANLSLYTAYVQYKNTLYPELSDMDNQEGSSPIGQDISTYESGLSALTSSFSPISSNGCDLALPFLQCRPFTPFIYQISVDAPLLANQSIYYDGSSIRVNGG